MARATGLEPAASGVTGRRSNQLSYARAFRALRTIGDPAERVDPAAAPMYCTGGGGVNKWLAMF